jgi:hypothetical protein
MIDGYARAVALAGTDAKFATAKTGWQESLTTWYKYRNADKTDGMAELVAGILAKPLPPEPTPLVSLPPSSTPAATPATNANGTASTTAPAGAANTKPTSTTPAKPTPPKPDKPRNRR